MLFHENSAGQTVFPLSTQGFPVHSRVEGQFGLFQVGFIPPDVSAEEDIF